MSKVSTISITLSFFSDVGMDPGRRSRAVYCRKITRIS